MSYINPSHKEPVALKEKVRYPIAVACVLDQLSDYDNPLIHQIRDYCINESILFTTRVYNSQAFAVDKDMIERLPAFHMYVKGSYMKTFYPVGRPFQHIDETIQTYIQRQEAKAQRKIFWKTAFSRMTTFFKKLLHRKTRMERYNEAKEKEEQTKQVRGWRSRYPVNEWS